MLIAIFALSVALVVFLLLWGYLQRYVRVNKQIQHRIRTLQEINDDKAQKAQPGQRKLSDIPFAERVIKPLQKAIEEYVSRFTPQQVAKLIGERLIMAGKARVWTVNQFCLACLIGAAAMWGTMFLLVWNSNYALIQRVMFLLLGSIMGGLMPVVLLNITIQKRQAAMQRQLPEVLDLLCVSVQAGLSFDAAMRKIVERMKGPFIDECRRLQEDIRMGMVRRTAMKNLATRCAVQDVSLFMTSLIQAERLGTSMGKTLKSQADNIRERRRQFVKAEALKAPVKIIFPLVLFIFPALFVVTLVPTVLFLMKNM